MHSTIWFNDFLPFFDGFCKIAPRPIKARPGCEASRHGGSAQQTASMALVHESTGLGMQTLLIRWIFQPESSHLRGQ
jgi:hypothetical protein